MSATPKTSAAARSKITRGKRLDLLEATEQDIVTAFATEAILLNPPLLPASMREAIEINRKLMSGAVGIIDSWRYGGDSRLAPLCTPGTHQPDAKVVMTVARRMMSVVVANHETMAQLYIERRREEDQT